MKVTIVGLGYVGMVTGTCLAAKGHEVTGVDVRSDLVGQLNNGRPHIFEPGLEELLQEVRKAGRFEATTDLQRALQKSDLVLIAVGTPSHDGAIDLTAIRDVARSVGRSMAKEERYLSVVVKSTVTPGTTNTIVRAEIAKSAGRDFPGFGLGMNPEFLREGSAIKDFMEPDRIVIGFEDERTRELLQSLYAPWQVEKVYVNTQTAEFIKYANNVLLATQISIVNELANLAAALGEIDMGEVMHAVHLDKRWNPPVDGRRLTPEILSYLMPGCGFGGSCFPKDLQALRALGSKVGLPMQMLSAILAVNDAQPGQVVSLLEAECGDLKMRRVLLLGLSFKSGTDDVREAASLKIASSLLQNGARLIAHDPVATANFARALQANSPALTFVDDWKTAVAAAEIVVIATAWPEYLELKECTVDGKLIFDARRLFLPNDFPSAKYLSIGRRFTNKGEGS